MSEREPSESTERCPVCLRPVRAERLSEVEPASHASGYCWRKESDWWHAARCDRLGYERVSRALAEAEKERDERIDTLARTYTKLVAAEERAEAREGERIRLRLENIRLKDEVSKITERACDDATEAELRHLIDVNGDHWRAAEERAATLEKALANLVRVIAGLGSVRGVNEKADIVLAEARAALAASRAEPRAAAPKAVSASSAAEERAAQAERALREIQQTAQDAITHEMKLRPQWVVHRTTLALQEAPSGREPKAPPDPTRETP